MEISDQLVSMGLLNDTKEAQYQLHPGGQVKGKTTLTSLVHAVEQAVRGGDDAKPPFVYGVDYEVFTVPGLGTFFYFIASGRAHFFLRGEHFKGAVYREWWESHGLVAESPKVSPTHLITDVMRGRTIVSGGVFELLQKVLQGREGFDGAAVSPKKVRAELADYVVSNAYFENPWRRTKSTPDNEQTFVHHASRLLGDETYQGGLVDVELAALLAARYVR